MNLRKVSFIKPRGWFSNEEKKRGYEEGYFHQWISPGGEDTFFGPFCLIEDVEGKMHRVSHREIKFKERPVEEVMEAAK